MPYANTNSSKKISINQKKINTMKISFAFLSVIFTLSEAFSPYLSHGRTNIVKVSSTSMNVDALENNLVKEALDATKKFGATSKEARLAWEAVEEVAARDNSVATLGNLNDECEVEEVSSDCLEYNKSLEKLQVLLEASKPSLTSLVDDISTSISQVKLAVPKSTAAPNSPELITALEEAKKVTEENGIDSPAAQVAWSTVEEIAAAGNSNAVGGALSAEECLVDAAKEACEAIEELNRMILLSEQSK